MKQDRSQPAEKSYFFHGGFVELADVVSEAFVECGDVIARSASGIAESLGGFSAYGTYSGWGFFRFIPSLFMFAFYLTRLIFCSVITPVIVILITIFQITILLSFFIFASIFFIFIILLDRLFCTINSITNHCPYCQRRFYMPVYVCSKCGAEHTRLRPGIYGILNRECNCGKRLPTTFFNGRQKLQAKCQYCNSDLKGGGLQASWCIPVVGGPSSGKTCYINMTMLTLEKQSKSKYGLTFVYEKNTRDEYEVNSDRLSKGYTPEKTTDTTLTYYQFSLTPNNATKQLISLCDVAGELFDVSSGGNDIGKQIGFRYANAFILILDPLSIASYRNEVSKTTSLNGYRGSVQPLDEMLDTFVRTLQNMFSIKASSMFNTDVAVIFAKADIPGLESKIGRSAVLKKASGSDQKTVYDTQNQLCEKFLRDYDENSFLINLKSRFKSIQFFTCSALGHVENGKPFAASNVEEPFFWLVKKKSSVIRNAIK